MTRLNNNNTHQCIHEERLTNIEVDIAELKTRMDNKKDDIHSINKELVHDRQQQIELIEKVTEVTVLLKAGQEQREANNRKFEDLEKKVDKVQEDLTNTRNDMTDFVASQRSFRNTVAIGAPIVISIIVGVLFKFI